MILEKRIPLKYWIKLIYWDFCIVLIFSSLIPFLHYFKVPISISTLLGTAIALLLSFKLNQSYERWWEARQIWGNIVNDSRILVMQLQSFLLGKESHLLKTISYRQIAWCYSLNQSLREDDPTKNINAYLSSIELESIKNKNHIPLSLLNNHSKDISNLHKNNHINNFQQIQLDNTILRLSSSMGGAERIKTTIFPKTYRITLHLFIYIFLILLSFGLIELGYLIEIPLLIIISIPFFLLEKIAFTIQDPFENRPSDIPMTAITKTISINIKELLNEPIVSENNNVDQFYIL